MLEIQSLFWQTFNQKSSLTTKEVVHIRKKERETRVVITSNVWPY